MTDNANTERTIDGRHPNNGRFLAGNNGGGRKPGSRNKLAGEFIDALYADFRKNGADAIKRVAAEEPAQYLRLIAQILPRELDIALSVNSDLFAEAQSFAQAYRLARVVIGADPSKMIELQAEFDNEMAGSV